MGGPGAAPSSLPEAIADLGDTSTVFLNRWQRRELDRAGEVSKRAMILLDFIANELLREKVKRKGTGVYANSAFAAEMSVFCGVGVTGASLSDQQSVVQSGPGHGSLPPQFGTPTPIELFKLLNKVKHRSPHLMNFRIEDERHIFLICTEGTGGGAEGIYEFDVEDFCYKCLSAAKAL